MQISAINLNNNFRSNVSDENGMQSVEEKSNIVTANNTSDTFQMTEEKATKLKQVAEELAPDKATSPITYFAVTLATAGVAFWAGKKAAGRILNYGIFQQNVPLQRYANNARKYIGEFIVNAKNNAKNKYVKGAFNKVLKYGENVLQDTELKSKLTAIFPKAELAEECAQSIAALNKGLTLTAGAGAATYNIMQRYKDEDSNGIPDAAEKAVNISKDVFKTASSVADALGII